MTEARPSLQSIVDHWSEKYGRRFLSSIRKEAIIELIRTMYSYGYSKEQIAMSERLAMAEMVGSRSKHGSLNDWKKAAARDWRVSMHEVFEPVELAPENIEIKPQLATEEEIKQQEEAMAKGHEEYQKNNEELLSTEEESQNDEIHYSSALVIRPEMDRSRFKDIKTTPMISEEEFWAALEREHNEQ